MNVVDAIRVQQTSWLKDRGVAFDGRGYTSTISDNLLVLSAEGQRELAAGRGNELGNAQRPGKIAAPWSSAALAINFFESWRGLDKRPLAEALEVRGGLSDLRFEATFSTGFGAIPAHLDVVFDGASTSTDRIAIESKFLEPFAGGVRGTLRKTISRAYLAERAKPRWHGLHALREFAEAIVEGKAMFYRLDAPQLIKHAVALQRAGKPFELVHLWYCPPGFPRQTERMESEIDMFREVIGRDGVRFRSLTYHDLFARVCTTAPEHTAYRDYLLSRYFLPLTTTRLPA
jgi:hypothetical protein